MFHWYQFSVQPKLTRQNQSYCTTKSYTILIASQRSVIVKCLSSSRINLVKCPRSRGYYHHTAMLPRMKCSKKAYLACRICGIKWLPHIQIVSSKKCMHETTCIHNFLYSLKNESVRSHSLLIHLLHNRCSRLICIGTNCVTLLLLSWRSPWPGYGKGL